MFLERRTSLFTGFSVPCTRYAAILDMLKVFYEKHPEIFSHYDLSSCKSSEKCAEEIHEYWTDSNFVINDEELDCMFIGREQYVFSNDNASAAIPLDVTTFAKIPLEVMAFVNYFYPDKTENLYMINYYI